MYLKIFKDNIKHYDMQYKKELNKDIKPFDPRPECDNDLFFSDTKYISFLRYGSKIAIVNIRRTHCST